MEMNEKDEREPRLAMECPTCGEIALGRTQLEAATIEEIYAFSFTEYECANCGHYETGE
jgi:predicted RNA-binding Zn-ribbon protein involved in translation (DUF1610 family)